MAVDPTDPDTFVEEDSAELDDVEAPRPTPPSSTRTSPRTRTIR
jgi:hypothetical protein